jgi:hypothetical protein
MQNAPVDGNLAGTDTHEAADVDHCGLRSAGRIHQHVHQPADRLTVWRQHRAAEDRQGFLGRHMLDLARRLRIGRDHRPAPSKQAANRQAKPKNPHVSGYPWKGNSALAVGDQASRGLPGFTICWDRAPGAPPVRI